MRQHSTFMQRSWRRVSFHINSKSEFVHQNAEQQVLGMAKQPSYIDHQIVQILGTGENLREKGLRKKKVWEWDSRSITTMYIYAFSDLFTCTVVPVVCLFVSFSCGVSTAHLALGSLMVSRHNTHSPVYRRERAQRIFFFFRVLVLSIAAGLKSFGGTNRRNPKTLTRARPSAAITGQQPTLRACYWWWWWLILFSLSTAHLLLLTTTTRLPI